MFVLIFYSLTKKNQHFQLTLMWIANPIGKAGEILVYIKTAKCRREYIEQKQSNFIIEFYLPMQNIWDWIVLLTAWVRYLTLRGFPFSRSQFRARRKWVQASHGNYLSPNGIKRSTKQISFEVAIYELSKVISSPVNLFHRQATTVTLVSKTHWALFAVRMSLA